MVSFLRLMYGQSVISDAMTEEECQTGKDFGSYYGIMGFENFTSVDLSARCRGHEGRSATAPLPPLQNFVYIAAGKSQIQEGPPSMEVPGVKTWHPGRRIRNPASLHRPFKG